MQTTSEGLTYFLPSYLLGHYAVHSFIVSVLNRFYGYGSFYLAHIGLV